MFKLFVIAALIAVASAASNPIDVQAQVRSFVNNPPNDNGAYSWNFETTNGIAQQESGTGGKSAQGTAAWYDPSGTPVSLSYIADEYGYRVSGSHLPQAPEVPAAIVRALEYIRTHSTPAPQVG